MTRAIGAIGGDVKVSGDEIFNVAILGNIAAITSSEFLFGQSQSALELHLNFIDAVVVAVSETVVVELLQDVESGGSFATSIVLQTYTNETIAANTMFEYVPTDDILPYCKLKVTTTEDHHTKTMSAYLTHIAR